MKVYRVKDKKTGEYHSDGNYTSKNGKIWTKIGHLKNHLNYLKPRGPDFDSEDFETWLQKFIVEEYELIETKTKEYMADELWQDPKNQD